MSRRNAGRVAEPRVRALLPALMLCLLSVFVVTATSSAAAASPVTSQAPDAADYAAITHAFRTDLRLGRTFRAHSRILEIRETVQGRPVARVFFTGIGAHPSSLGGSAFSAFYFGRTGEWRPDYRVSKKLANSLRLAPTRWNVRYVGSGTETTRGSSPGEVDQNPDCQIPPVTEKGQSRFAFDASWQLSVVGLDTSGVGKTTGTGTNQTDEQSGCIWNSGPVAPQSSHCSVTFRGSLVQGAFHSQLSAVVDRAGNHELRLRLPIPANDPPLCGAPEAWETDADGPIAYEHSILVPDARLARDSSFYQKVGFSEKVFEACLFAKPQITCNAQMGWTGRIAFVPVPLPTLKDMNFYGPAPNPGYPNGGGGSRG